ncbi:hypothetical protein GGR53DRAFT_274371 [Hypoxylon sp. FL1150]|nr:hypothetical protein GGR53DRAFT_274371 [Hypoxylon sp. FL1150]
MAASRRGQPELQVRLPSTSNLATALPDLPPISALFLIDFDVKAGYTISWKAAKPGVELEGVVEYKSLPSGLHTVSEDLIYFVHDGFAGLSAFVNAPVQDTEARNARMLAVGVLVPLSYGRLGRAWRHAEGLKAMTTALAENSKDVSVLEKYWEKNQARDETKEEEQGAPAIDTPSASFQTPKIPSRGHVRNRSASDGGALLQPGHRLSPFHPAWSLTKLLDTFGPLIFPIQRAALLRKRILISCHAPVQEACNFVYDISILSNIPQPTFDILSPSSPPHRLRPLFTIGVHDIPFLVEDAKTRRNSGEQSGSEQEAGTGWIACTTDSILAKKDTLWDLLITMPPPHAAKAKQRAWLKLEGSQGVSVKATQRDLRRFRSLKAGLARFQQNDPSASPATTPRTATPRDATNDPFLDEAEEREVVEPLSWTALAYNGFMWWASAGEQARSEQAEESAHDADLLADANPSSSLRMEVPRSSPAADLSTSIASFAPRRRPSITTVPSSSSTTTAQPLVPDEARVELAVIAYFHRLTTQLLNTLADVLENTSDDEDEDEEIEEDSDDDGRRALLPSDSGDDDVADGRGARVRSDAVVRMGLDVWSAADAEFVAAVAAAYFGRRAYVEGKGVQVCGVKVC